MWEIIQTSTVRGDYVAIAVTFFIIWAMFVAWIYSFWNKNLNINQK